MGCETSHALRVSVDVAMNYDELAKRPAVFVGTLEEPQLGRNVFCRRICHCRKFLVPNPARLKSSEEALRNQAATPNQSEQSKAEFFM